MTVGEAIKLARDQAGMTQAQLAEKIGLSYRSIQEYERDAIDATRHLAKIEKATGVSEGWIQDHVDPYSRVAQMADVLEEIRDVQRQILELLVAFARSFEESVRSKY